MYKVLCNSDAGATELQCLQLSGGGLHHLHGANLGRSRREAHHLADSGRGNEAQARFTRRWNNRLVPNRKRSTSRLYIVTLLI